MPPIIVDRFAPSPTSDLHVGNLRTALAGWLLTRADGGQWLVRIEDLDRDRVRAADGAAARNLADLASLGLQHDGDVVVQGERLDAYRDALATLSGRTYECFCTRREIAEAASAPHDGHRAYPGTCSRLSSAQAARLRESRPAAIRVRAEGASMTVRDLVAGDVTAPVDDFVLVRGDGAFAYNLAVVVDDIAQGVTHITRGADLLESAPRQAWLTQRLGGIPAVYCHVGLVTNPDGQRLSKRDGAVTMGDLAAAGLASSDVLAMLTAALGLGAQTSLDDALDVLRTHGPGPRFFSGAIWDEESHQLGQAG